jgi:hypothetical protein
VCWFDHVVGLVSRAQPGWIGSSVTLHQASRVPDVFLPKLLAVLPSAGMEADSSRDRQTDEHRLELVEHGSRWWLAARVVLHEVALSRFELETGANSNRWFIEALASPAARAMAAQSLWAVALTA